MIRRVTGMTHTRRTFLKLAAFAAMPALRAEDSPATGLAEFDKLMASFIESNKVPGAALAIAKGGRLVYSRGFGYSDVEKKEPVAPDALFRIASVSKPIT